MMFMKRYFFTPSISTINNDKEKELENYGFLERRGEASFTSFTKCKDEADKKKNSETKCLLHFINNRPKTATYILYVKEKTTTTRNGPYTFETTCKDGLTHECDKKNGKWYRK